MFREHLLVVLDAMLWVLFSSFYNTDFDQALEKKNLDICSFIWEQIFAGKAEKLD